jgi:hypothetical protein
MKLITGTLAEIEALGSPTEGMIGFATDRHQIGRYDGSGWRWGWGFGNTIVVAKSGGDYTSIQDAIDAASSDDTILIMAGTYTGDLTVDAAVELRGVGENTTIAGEVSVTVDQVVISDLRIYCNHDDASTHRGVYHTAGELTIRNCRIVMLQDGSGTSVGVASSGAGVETYLIGTRVYVYAFSGSTVQNVAAASSAEITVIQCDLELLGPGTKASLVTASGTTIEVLFTSYDTTAVSTSGTLTKGDAHEIITSLFTVDGHLSGLDADTLDGSHLSALATYAELTAHAALDTGVHGAGGDTLATDADIDADIATHAALDTGVHGAGGDTLATDADIATHDADETAHGIEYILPFGSYNLLQAGRTVTSYDAVTLPFDCTINSFHCTLQVATTNDGSHYWTATLYRRDGTALGSFDTSGIAADTWARLEDTSLSNNVLTAATHLALYITWSKTGSPGALRLHNPVAIATK